MRQLIQARGSRWGWWAGLFGAAGLLLSGCQTTSSASNEVLKNSMASAPVTAADIDVGINLFTFKDEIVAPAGSTTAATPLAAGGSGAAGPTPTEVVLPDVEQAPRALREVETYVLPVLLRDVMVAEGDFRSVSVRPSARGGAGVHDLVVDGEIVRSTGNFLVVNFTVKDSSGRKVLGPKVFTREIPMEAYAPGATEDPYAPLFRDFLAELTRAVGRLKPTERWAKRELTEVAYAAALAPVAFDRHLRENRRGEATLVSLPAEGDPFYRLALRSAEEELRIVQEDFGAYFSETNAAIYPQYFDWRREYGSSLARFNALTDGALAKRRTATATGTIRDLAVGAAIGALVVWSQGGDPGEGAAIGAAAAGVMVLAKGIRVDSDGNLRFNLAEAYANDPAFREAFETARAEQEQAKSHHAYMVAQSEVLSRAAEPMSVRLFNEVVALEGTLQQQYGVMKERLAAIYREESGIL